MDRRLAFWHSSARMSCSWLVMGLLCMLKNWKNEGLMAALLCCGWNVVFDWSL